MLENHKNGYALVSFTVYQSFKYYIFILILLESFRNFTVKSYKCVNICSLTVIFTVN